MSLSSFARLALSLVVFSLAGCASMPVGQDLATSWDKALVYLPEKAGSTTPDAVNLAAPLPVVIYLHGCSGITPHNDIPWAEFISRLGFVVILPDSLARKDRPLSCSGYSHTWGGVHKLRLDEMAYALDRVRSMKWVDAKNVFLMGHSEGAVAAARTRIHGFRGIVISSWTCTDTHPLFNGLFTPLETPVLSMGWDTDPWFSGRRFQGSCEDKFDGRKNARHITFSGVEHSTVQQPVARQAVAEFLRTNLQSGKP